VENRKSVTALHSKQSVSYESVTCNLGTKDMVNIDIAGVLDYPIGEGANPAAGNDPAAFVISKSNVRGGGGDERFGTAILAVTIDVIPAVTEC